MHRDRASASVRTTVDDLIMLYHGAHSVCAQPLLQDHDHCSVPTRSGYKTRFAGFMREREIREEGGEGEEEEEEVVV